MSGKTPGSGKSGSVNPGAPLTDHDVMQHRGSSAGGDADVENPTAETPTKAPTQAWVNGRMLKMFVAGVTITQICNSLATYIQSQQPVPSQAPTPPPDRFFDLFKFVLEPADSRDGMFLYSVPGYDGSPVKSYGYPAPETYSCNTVMLVLDPETCKPISVQWLPCLPPSPMPSVAPSADTSGFNVTATAPPPSGAPSATPTKGPGGRR